MPVAVARHDFWLFDEILLITCSEDYNLWKSAPSEMPLRTVPNMDTSWRHDTPTGAPCLSIL